MTYGLRHGVTSQQSPSLRNGCRSLKTITDTLESFPLAGRVWTPVPLVGKPSMR